MDNLYGAMPLIISIIAIILSVKANVLSSGNIELYINERISDTNKQVQDLSVQFAPLLVKDQSTLNGEEKKILVIYTKIFKTALEDNLNAYEEACAKYNDRKVDRNRFKKMYKDSIRQLVESEDYKRYFDTVSSKYQAILKVYKGWEVLEK
jgi:hypothetical protein